MHADTDTAHSSRVSADTDTMADTFERTSLGYYSCCAALPPSEARHAAPVTTESTLLGAPLQTAAMPQQPWLLGRWPRFALLLRALLLGAAVWGGSSPQPGPVCEDLPGWRDSEGSDCDIYRGNNWCCDPADTTECDSDAYAPTSGQYHGQGPTTACCASCTVRRQMCNDPQTGGNSTAFTLAGTLEYNSSASGSASCSVVIQAPQPSHRVRVAFEVLVLQAGYRVEFFNSVEGRGTDLMLQLRPPRGGLGSCRGLECVATGGGAGQHTGVWPAFESADSTVLVRLTSPAGGAAADTSSFSLSFTFERGTCSDGAATAGESGGADCGGACGTCVLGCTELGAANYAAAATRDDGSCTFGGNGVSCIDSTADNYNPAAQHAYPGTCRYTCGTTWLRRLQHPLPGLVVGVATPTPRCFASARAWKAAVVGRTSQQPPSAAVLALVLPDTAASRNLAGFAWPNATERLISVDFRGNPMLLFAQGGAGLPVMPYRVDLQGGGLLVRHLTFSQPPNCSFHYGASGARLFGGALSIRAGAVLQVTHCRFLDLQADNGGALGISGSRVLVEDSTFERCHADFGGAIKAESTSGYFDLTISRSRFLGNFVKCHDRRSCEGAALNIDGYIQGAGASDTGAHLRVENSELRHNSVVMNTATLADSRYRSGTASTNLIIGGWAVKLNYMKPSRWSFHNTTIAPFGPQFTVAASLSGTSTCDLHPCPAGQKCSAYSGSLWCEECPPTLFSDDGIQCGACPAGKEPDNERKACVNCAPGKFSDGGKTRSKCSRCPHKAVALPDSTGCQQCIPGLETPSERGTECVCLPGTWAGYSSHNPCTLCSNMDKQRNVVVQFEGPSANAYCPGGPRELAGIFPRPGYWFPAPLKESQSDARAIAVYSCQPPGSCTGLTGNLALACRGGRPDSCCHKNHRGVLCAHCANSATQIKNAQGICIECPKSTPRALIQRFLYLLGLVALLQWKAGQIDVDIQGARLGILTFFFQTLSLLSEQDGSKFGTLFGFASLFNINQKSEGQQCSLRFDYLQNFYLNVLWIPLILLMLAVAMSLWADWRNKRHSGPSCFEKHGQRCISAGPKRSNCCSCCESCRDKVELAIQKLLMPPTWKLAFLTTASSRDGTTQQPSSMTEDEFKAHQLWWQASCDALHSALAQKYFWRLILEIMMFSYIGVTKNAVAMFMCHRVEGVLYSVVDMAARCDTPEHRLAQTVAMGVVLSFSLGLPILIQCKTAPEHRASRFLNALVGLSIGVLFSVWVHLGQVEVLMAGLACSCIGYFGTWIARDFGVWKCCLRSESSKRSRLKPFRFVTFVRVSHVFNDKSRNWMVRCFVALLFALRVTASCMYRVCLTQINVAGRAADAARGCCRVRADWDHDIFG
jgi:hypothetical protein